jgi:hypothetical protein
LVSNGDLEIVGVKKGVDGATYPLYKGREYVVCMIFNCPEKQRWRDNFLQKRWPITEEQIACKNCRMLKKPQN